MKSKLLICITSALFLGISSAQAGYLDFLRQSNDYALMANLLREFYTEAGDTMRTQYADATSNTEEFAEVLADYDALIGYNEFYTQSVTLFYLYYCYLYPDYFFDIYSQSVSTLNTYYEAQYNPTYESISARAASFPSWTVDSARAYYQYYYPYIQANLGATVMGLYTDLYNFYNFYRLYYHALGVCYDFYGYAYYKVGTSTASPDYSSLYYQYTVLLAYADYLYSNENGPDL